MASVIQEKPIDLTQPDDSPTVEVKFPWAVLLIMSAGLLLVAGFYRWYQNTYSFTVGLDYFEQEFQTYWMSLFWIQLAVIFSFGAFIVPYLWFTREKVLDISPQEELNRYYTILTILSVGGLALYFALNLFTEADAAWHQVTIRDTDFTPTHIVLFYAFIPLMAVGLVYAFVWIHTRMPDYVGRVSAPLAVLAAGPLLIGPNLGYNEWGHTFFYAEELFGAPIHWGFVVLGWAFLALAGFLYQCFARMARLTDLIGENYLEDPIKM